MNGRRIRVLVVEDSRTVRERLCEVLASDPGLEIVESVDDGARAIASCKELRPDVVTMDMMLPLMTGLAATEYIMAHCPTPILVVSSSTNRGELFKMYEALAAGAVDVLEKPSGDEPEGDWERRFIATVKLVSRVPVITHLRGRLGLPGASPAPQAPVAPPVDGSARRFAVVAVGASTGGPSAVVRILQSLPSSFELPILLVVHIGERFRAAFADWLDGVSARRVAYATEGLRVDDAIGRVVLAPPGRHLIVHQGRFRLTAAPERHSCRPSIDVLFESVAREYAPTGAGCLLTGMGRDGAAGLLEIRRAGGLTIAQDEATSVVYGMPREAALLGAAERVLALADVGPALVAAAQPGVRS